jgi:hypothetical protein
MSWKRALFVGGALLLLSACDQATAPQPQLKQLHGRAAAQSGKNGQTTAPQTATTTATECRGSYSVSVGKTDCQE